MDDITVLRIELSKQADFTTVLKCIREDGSFTWQKQTLHAAHFVLHDLTHYAVETALGYESGFFGMIAAGWDIDDTTGKGSRGAIPAQALEVEKIVGLFDTERRSGVIWTADEFNEYSPRALSQTAIQKVRELRGRLFHQWSELAAGGKLELAFSLEEK